MGTYSDNITALGRLANKQLRQAKMRGHKAFDPLWKGKPKYFSSRPKAYKWLSKKMGIDIDKTHFGMFTEEQCGEATSLCRNLKKSKLKHFYILKANIGL